MDLLGYCEEFKLDWQLAGKAAGTADIYGLYLAQLDAVTNGEVTLADVKRWLADAPSARTARARGSAVRAFGKWAAENDGPDWSWWSSVPLKSVKTAPQPTVSIDDYERAARQASTIRDRLVVEMLWCTGMRVSELARLAMDDVSLQERSAVVRQAKSGRPRLVPLSDRACRLIRRLPARRDERLLGMTASAIRQLMRRLECPSPHAWRRGWAVHSLRSGVSETSVRAAGGWSSTAMVSRYTAAASSGLAMDEFRRINSG